MGLRAGRGLGEPANLRFRGALPRWSRGARSPPGALARALAGRIGTECGQRPVDSRGATAPVGTRGVRPWSSAYTLPGSRVRFARVESLWKIRARSVISTRHRTTEAGHPHPEKWDGRPPCSGYGSERAHPSDSEGAALSVRNSNVCLQLRGNCWASLNPRQGRHRRGNGTGGAHPSDDF
jgi:hypothetical protein